MESALTPERTSPVRLNIGCGGRLLEGYVNVDMDSLEDLKKRYPDTVFPQGLSTHNLDIFNLPFADGTVEEIRADSLVEHLSFSEEPLFFREARRVLRAGGLLRFDTPDFEGVVKLWLAAKDDWKDFFRSDPDSIAKQHWFGNYSYSTDNRWGYLSAMIFGSQNGPGQYHKNCYTEGKIRAMAENLGFEIQSLERYLWKGDRDPMLAVRALRTP